MARRYKVSGMDCAEETAALRQTVGRLSGVTSLSFNLINGVMKVEVLEGGPDDASILNAVRRAGLVAERQHDAAGQAGEAATTTGARRYSQSALFCGASGILSWPVSSHTRFCTATSSTRWSAAAAGSTTGFP